MLIFENSGEIDPQLITLIGVNVKEGPSPIGFFGTGLKYAVACLLRWDESIIIQSGQAEFKFSKEPTTLRGKAFDLIKMFSRMDSLQLGFTTELGKTWEPWMVYRELWCNAHDEPGAKVWISDKIPYPTQGKTRVIVDGEKILSAHKDRNRFILDPDLALIHATEGVDLLEGPGHAIFYRGIAVQGLDKPSLYTYNIKEKLWLTEDRTADRYQTDSIIARGVAELTHKPTIESILLAKPSSMEHRLDWDYVFDPGETWSNVAGALAQSQPANIHKSVVTKFHVKPQALCPHCGRPMP